MKKSGISIIAILFLITLGIVSQKTPANSQVPTIADTNYAATCKVGEDNVDMCCVDYNEALDAAQRDWLENMKDLMDQEIPASDMVGDGYENLRTYNCWSEYICRSVQYSGFAPIESAMGTGLTSDHLGIAPGCQKPEDLKMETEYSELMEAMSDLPVLGVSSEALDNVFVNNRINYLPRCQSDTNNNQEPNISLITARYDACKETLERKFGCPPGTDSATCSAYPNAFTNLETNLKKAHASQKTATLERKLGSIVSKMHVMEAHVQYLAESLLELDARLICYIGKCQ